MIERQLTIGEILDYEVKSSLWAHLISNSFMQNLAGSYFSWRVRKKYGRYLLAIEVYERLKAEEAIKSLRWLSRIEKYNEMVQVCYDEHNRHLEDLQINYDRGHMTRMEYLEAVLERKENLVRELRKIRNDMD